MRWCGGGWYVRNGPVGGDLNLKIRQQLWRLQGIRGGNRSVDPDNSGFARHQPAAERPQRSIKMTIAPLAPGTGERAGGGGVKAAL